MKRLSKKAKIKYIEKSIEVGLEKIPEQERIRLEKDEKTRNLKKLQETKQSLWRLRKKENRLQNPETEKIKNMTKKLETIKQILDKEKEIQEKKEKLF